MVGFYFFAVLDPGWNWRWAIDPHFPFQKYIFVCLLIGWVLNGMPGIRYRGKAAIPIVGLISFLGLAYVSSFTTLDPLRSGWYLGQLWKIVLVAVLAAITIDSPKKLVILLFAVVIAQGYNAYQINLQYFQDGMSIYARMTNWGSKGDNNTYSILTIPVFAMSLALASCDFRPSWRLLALGIAVLQVHEIMLLESRGAMLGTCVMMAFLLYFVPKTRLNKLFIAVFMIVGFLLAGPSVVEEFSSAFASEEKRDSSAESRFYLWQAGWDITLDHPVLGVGPHCGALVVKDHYHGELDNPVKELHNLVFELSTGTGVPATTLYMMFFIVPWWYCFRRRDWSGQDDPSEIGLSAARLAVLCGVPGYMCASMFSSGALLETGYILAACGCSAVALASQRESLPDVELEHDSSLMPSQ